MKNIDVCPNPELLHLYKLDGKIAVVVDIFRATSCMTTAFAHGVAKIIPVASSMNAGRCKSRASSPPPNATPARPRV
jgi:phosphosulfolactate phosphohydrolase-like enzyme